MVYEIHFFECGICGKQWDMYSDAEECQRTHEEAA